MKEKEFRRAITRHKVFYNSPEYQIIIRTTDRQGNIITSRIFEVKADHKAKVFLLETIEFEFPHQLSI